MLALLAIISFNIIHNITPVSHRGRHWNHRQLPL
jgi:hypothetical protein